MHREGRGCRGEKEGITFLKKRGLCECIGEVNFWDVLCTNGPRLHKQRQSGKWIVSQIHSPYGTNSRFRVLKRQCLWCCLWQTAATQSFQSGWWAQLGGVGGRKGQEIRMEWKAKADLTWIVSNPDLLWFYRRQSWPLCRKRCRGSSSIHIRLPYVALTISGHLCAWGGGLCIRRQQGWGHRVWLCVDSCEVHKLESGEELHEWVCMLAHERMYKFVKR